MEFKYHFLLLDHTETIRFGEWYLRAQLQDRSLS